MLEIMCVFGYAVRGMTPICNQFLARDQRVNAIAAISITGLQELELTRNTINADIFYDCQRISDSSNVVI